MFNIGRDLPFVPQFRTPLAAQRPISIVYPIFCVGMSLYNPCYVAQPRVGGFAGHQLIYFCFADCSCPRHLLRRPAQFRPAHCSTLLRRLLVGRFPLCLLTGFVTFGALVIMLGRPLLPLIGITAIPANFSCCVDFSASFASTFRCCLCHFCVLLCCYMINRFILLS